MFERLKKAVRDTTQRAGAAAGLSKEYKSVFDVSGVPAFNQFYNYGVFVWKHLYKGFYNSWHIVNAPTVANPSAKRELFRMDTAKAICAELAGLVWAEECNVSVNRRGFIPTAEAPEDDLQQFINHVLRENGFSTKMQESIEQALALGGCALKVWYEPKRGADGSEIAGQGKIKIGYCMADQFVPTAWDNSRITEGVFISRQAKGGYYYTRLEWHKWNGETYVVTNELYKADQTNGARESQDILGYRIPLNVIYSTMAEETELNGVEQSLFSYFRTPVANNLDDNSPLGVSIYGNALSTLHAIDICFDSFVREFRLGKKRIIVPARCVRTVTDPATGELRRYFDSTDETYEALATDDPNGLRIQDNSVELRVSEHVDAMNALLSILCLQVGFSASSFSFDAAGGLKTATEVISENSKTYKTIANCQSNIKPAIESLVANIITIAELYDVSYNGVSVESMVRGGYDCVVSFDDSVVQDRQTNINEGILLVGNRLMSGKTFMIEKLGYTPERADAEIAEINNEGSAGIDVIERLNALTGE